MICPIMSKAYLRYYDCYGVLINPPGINSTECVERNCAWWDWQSGWCSVSSISSDLMKLRRLFEKKV